MRNNSKIKRKAWLMLSIVFNLGMLGFFKYSGFFAENINAITGLDIPVLSLTLPLGISFYTFQSMSYVIDVYRREVAVQKNYLLLLLYVSLFPCNECAKAIIQSGIKTVIYDDDKYANTPGNICSRRMFDAAGVEYRKYQRTGRRIAMEV